jgi:hypothetical protein
MILFCFGNLQPWCGWYISKVVGVAVTAGSITLEIRYRFNSDRKIYFVNLPRFTVNVNQQTGAAEGSLTSAHVVVSSTGLLASLLINESTTQRLNAASSAHGWL